jgi:hypothetical protein
MKVSQLSLFYFIRGVQRNAQLRHNQSSIMDAIQSIFSLHYKNADYCNIIDYIKEKSQWTDPDPYREEYYDEYTILFTENFDVKCIRITKVYSTGNVYVSNIDLDDAKELFHNNDDAVDTIELYLFAKKECEDVDHIVIKQKKYLQY